MADMTPEEIAAIRAEFAVPVAMEDVKNGVSTRSPIPMQMPQQVMPGGYGMPPMNNGIRPDGSVGVPQGGGYGGGMRMDIPPQSYCDPYPAPPQHPGCCVYEDGGQKFMIKNGCIYKQTWTTIENGGECRMFDVKKGKKVQPKGIVIQKYDWVPLSAINAMDAAFSSDRQKTKRKVFQPVAMPPPSVTPPRDPVGVPVSDPVDGHEARHAEQPSIAETAVPTSDEKPVVPLKKPEPVAKPVAKPSVEKPVVAKQSVRKPSVPNAGIVRKTSKPVSDKD